MSGGQSQDAVSQQGTAIAKALKPDPEAPCGWGGAGQGAEWRVAGAGCGRGEWGGGRGWSASRGMHRPDSLGFLRWESSQRGVWQEWPGPAPHWVDAKMTDDRG